MIRSTARRFGAVWLVRAASHLAWLLSVSQLRGRSNEMDERLMDERLVALQQCEDEVCVIAGAAEKLRKHVEGCSPIPRFYSETGTFSGSSISSASTLSGSWMRPSPLPTSPKAPL